MKKMEGMEGFLVAAVTPFDEEGKVNRDAMNRLMEKNIGEGARGFLIGGSSAEASLLSREERIAMMETAAMHARRNEVRLIAGVSAIATEEAVEYGKIAKELGYDAIISTVPYYYKFGMAGIAGYMRTLKEKTDMPLFLYNFPGNTGIEIDVNDWAIHDILTDGTISGVKQTSLNLYQMERIRNMNPELVIYGGYDEVYLGARILGADGAIGSTFNFTLPLFTKIEAAYQAMNLTEAQNLQHRANNIMQALVSCSLFPSIKHILKKQGVDCGECREPFPKLDEEQKAFIEKVVEENM